MGMTREEAIKALRIEGIEIGGKAKRLAEFMVALDVAQKALRPVSRDQVEKAWSGEWIIQERKHSEFIKKCSKCGFPISGWWGRDRFCANCGSPMTDEAVDIMLKRMEALLND